MPSGNATPTKPRDSGSSNTNAATATAVLLNLSEPSQVAEAVDLPVDGVGLLRAELMVIEALRHGVRFVRAYILGGFLIAISVISSFCG